MGHVSMADPFDVHLSKVIHTAISRPGVLEGEEVKAHSAGTVICIGTIDSIYLSIYLYTSKKWANDR